MGFFRSLKGKVDVGTDDSTTGSQYDSYSTAEEKRRVFGNSSSSKNTTTEEYNPPPGPPPSHQSEFSPPPGPPPDVSKSARRQDDEETYAPPSGPPPPQHENPPPYHDWTVIPDTALLPPPPPLPQDYSPTNNASYDSATRAHEWCDRHPLYTPSRPSRDIHDLAGAGHLTLERPPAQLCDKKFILRRETPTTWSVRTSSQRQQDAIIMSSIPLYFAAVDNPLVSGRSKIISFEIHVLKISDANSGIAIGYAAKPYPPWRLPGWHRASVGVHGDDGRRFVNDSWGGRDFVEPFRPGETIRVGMRFSATPAAAAAAAAAPAGKVKTTAFVARNGRTNKDWEWEIDEERDERDEGVDGLMGEGDLYPAIGVFGGVEFEVRFGLNDLN